MAQKTVLLCLLATILFAVCIDAARAPPATRGTAGAATTTITNTAAAAATYTTTTNDAGAAARATTAAAPAEAAKPQRLRLALTNDQEAARLGPGFEALDVEVTPETPTRVRVRIAPTAAAMAAAVAANRSATGGAARWEVPESLVPRPGAQPASLAAAPLGYAVRTSAPGEPFWLAVSRRAAAGGNGDAPALFDTRGHRLLFKDQYIELTTALPADADLYGLGEVTLATGFRLPRGGKTVTMWARDMAAAVRDANLYSAHPFYLQVNSDGSAHGVLMLNSNGMDITLGDTALTYRMIGGLIDLYLFTGPSPEQVVRQYHEVVGAPAMPPYWALGAHQGRWGYRDVAMLEEAVANYSRAGLPLEGLWVDIEYMANRFQVMSFDEQRFPAAAMAAFAARLRAAGQHWAPIVNPGVALQPGFAAYDEGTRDGIWVKDAVTGKPYLGQVWPGAVVFPDFLASANASAWAARQLRRMYERAPFDGLWLDMTEAANFCSGMSCALPTRNATAMARLEYATPADFNVTDLTGYRTTCQLECVDAPASERLAHPPHALRNFAWAEGGGNGDNRDPDLFGVRDASLDLKGISVTARNTDGSSQYDTHNLYGTSMAKAFHAAFKSASGGRRPFLLTRSTSPGAGRYTGHWTGDTSVSWDSLRESVAGILNSNLWGLAMSGADVCGYGIDTLRLDAAGLEELCERWTSAGAFYPFSRNHMNYFTQPHEPYRWPSVTAAARKAYGLRYRLLPYLYSSMFVAARRGGTLARALLWTDPADPHVRNATRQWMLGEAVLVSPVLDANTTALSDARFTRGAWYSAWDYSRLLVPGPAAAAASNASSALPPLIINVPRGDVAVHFRGGAVVPMQQYAPVTRDVRTSNVTLVVALPAEPAAPPLDDASGGGPLPPYAHEEHCAAARARSAGQLVSCGLFYADDDAADTSSDASTLQAWFTSTAAPDGRSGTLASTVKVAPTAASSSNVPPPLRATAVHILGVPPNLFARGGGGSGSVPAARVAVAQKQPQPQPQPQPPLGQKPAAAAGAVPVVPAAPAAAAAATAEYDAAVGALRITGLDLDLSRPFAVDWSLLLA